MGSSLRRNMLLVEAIVNQEALQQGGTGVVRLAELAGLDKSQASRGLRALETAGVVHGIRAHCNTGWAGGCHL